MPAVLRKERVHLTGTSNRTFDAEEPRDFDATMRSHAKRDFEYKMTDQVPIIRGGRGNHDFLQSLPGFLFRFPGQYKKSRDTTLKSDITGEDTAKSLSKDSAEHTLKIDTGVAREKEVHDNVKPVPRWKARHWWEAPTILRHPLKKEVGETWNAYDSLKPPCERKGQDEMMRAMRHPTDQDSEDAQSDKPKEEFYHDRCKVDGVDIQPTNDWAIRPVYMQEFARNHKDDPNVSLDRISRIQSVLRGRYAGRPSLLRTFSNYSLTKPGYIFPDDLKTVLGNMGIKVTKHECKHLISAVDKDAKGAMAFEEFADFIYAKDIIGGGPENAMDRQAHQVEKHLTDLLISRSPQLSTAFCDIDPERNYVISKAQFANAVSTAVNHVTSEMIDFLWASQFADVDLASGGNIDNGGVDWRSFMSQLASYANEHRAVTPCTHQGRKTQYDLLQRTVPITDGILPPVDLNRPDQNSENEVIIVADKLTCKETNLSSMPNEAAFLTNHYVDYIHKKANRAQRALSELMPQEMLTSVLQTGMTRTEAVEAIMGKLERQQEEYAVPQLDTMALDALTSGPMMTTKKNVPAYLRIERADIQALLGCEHVNVTDQINAEEMIHNIYTTKLPMDEVNDGLNRALRLKPPARERPQADTDNPRYENHWQARYSMETIAEAIEKADVSNGGRLKSYKVFKRLDSNGDGYISISDMREAIRRYKIPLGDLDVQALLTEMDPKDTGSIDLSHFTRHFGIFQGSLLDSLQKTVKGVYRGGGVENGGPLHDRMREQIEEAEKAVEPLPEGETERSGSQARSTSEPPTPYSISSSYRDRTVYRTSDVIKRRTDRWKPLKSELINSLPPSRFGRTIYVDTRHITEPIGNKLISSYLPEKDRFKTSYLTANAFAPPDPSIPQVADRLHKNAMQDFREDRVRRRQNEVAMKLQISEECGRDFDEKRIARKALNKLNYERRVRMSCI